MKKKIIFFSFVVAVLLCLCSCTKKSILHIRFIDVGQGDSALIECDRHYMLIDGGDKAAGNKVYKVLEKEGIQHLDIVKP